MAVIADERFRSRIIHRSIVKEVVRTDSTESGCKSADEEDAGLMKFTSTFESSERTIVGGSANDLRDTDEIHQSNNASMESIPRRYTSASSPCTQRLFQRFGHDRLRSVSPNSCRSAIKQDTSVPSRSQSMERLSLAPLHETTTGDSGTGDSMTHIPAETFHYDKVPVYGLDKMVLLTDRYAIDPTLITDYKNKKRGVLSAKSSDKHSNSGKEIKADINREISRDSNKSIWSRLVRSFTKPPPLNPYVPAIRHHPSHASTDEDR